MTAVLLVAAGLWTWPAVPTLARQRDVGVRRRSPGRAVDGVALGGAVLAPVVLEASVAATESLTPLLTAKRVREAVRHARDAWLDLVAAADGASDERTRYCAECAGPNSDVSSYDAPSSQFCSNQCWQRCVVANETRLIAQAPRAARGAAQGCIRRGSVRTRSGVALARGRR